MIQLTSIHTNHKHYSFVEELLHAAFPQNERRDDTPQRELTDKSKKFHCLLIESELENPVGVITYWDFMDFIYIEHFAIDESLRGLGYGTKALIQLLTEKTKPVILEVEIPHKVYDIAYNRIEFYKRLGFKLRRSPYRQPPYRWNDNWLPMKLMTYGDFNFKPRVVKTIHQEVYGIID